MRDLIHPIGGFEIATLTWVKQAPATAVSLNMEGWLWYMILFADVIIDNTGGAVAANAHVFTLNTGVSAMRALSGITAGAAASQETFFGLASASFTAGAGNPNTSSLPLVFVPNASSLNVSFIGGDAATRVDRGSVTIIGLKRNTMIKQ